MARDVRATLMRAPRSISPKYFYDEVGSRLFDRICDLPEYYLTRAERALLAHHAEAIVARVRASSLIELGSGMARKTGPLLRGLCARVESPLYVPFDIAPEPICQSAEALLAEFPRLRVRGVVGDFVNECERLTLAVARSSSGPRLYAFLGSTLGNFDEKDAPALLRSVASLMTREDALLLGVDLVKDTPTLEAAYNDSKGVTAAFNKNVLRVISRELDGDVDERSFDHFATYDERLERIEMHLISRQRQALTFRAADLRVELTQGEHVLTEISRKFTRSSTIRTLAEAGMRLVEWLPAVDGAFALCLAAIA
jgi:L-histidine N-alpha-methyltransferase